MLRCRREDKTSAECDRMEEHQHLLAGKDRRGADGEGENRAG